MNEQWPFDQPPNCAVMTTKDIIKDGAPILHVTHDSDDHGWQFLGAATPEVNNAAVVSLSEILELDPSIFELATMAPGWEAWRESGNHVWTVKRQPTEGH